MSENTGGKRLAPDQNKKKKIAVLVVCAVLAFLLGAYVGLCAYASRDVMWPNTTVMGVDVSGLSISQAKAAVEDALARRWAGQSIKLREPNSGVEFSVPMEGLAEPEDLTRDLEKTISGHPFLTRGARYVMGLMELNREQAVPTLCYTQQGQERLGEVKEEIGRELGVKKRDTTYTITDTRVIFRHGITGIGMDTDTFYSGLHEALVGTGEPEIPISLIQIPFEDPDFDDIRSKVRTEASAAYLDRESGEVVPSVTGKDFDIGKAKAALESAEEGSICPVELELTIPSPTTEELNETLFRDVLGEASTRVTGTADRHMNVGVAAEFLNGHIVFPGEEFSFNQVCSPYTVANGYGKATAYVNGLSKDTVAGGICQASSTLYWATLKANLETVERSAHRYEPSYIRGGLDATVYGDYGDEGGLDFRFKNTSEHPIKLEAYVDKKNNLHVLIHGTDTTGIHGEPYSANRVITKAYETIYEARETIPQGTTRKDPERTGYNGVSIETYQRLLDAEGKVVEEKFLYKTKYYSRNEVIFFNPADIWTLNIDPLTGKKVVPGESPAPGSEGPIGDPLTSPGPSGAPGTIVPPPEVGESQGPILHQPGETEAPTPSAEAPAPPAESQKPLEEFSPGLPVVPTPEPDPDEPVLPPGL